jgi:hypothetical protein
LLLHVLDKHEALWLRRGGDVEFGDLLEIRDWYNINT